MAFPVDLPLVKGLAKSHVFTWKAAGSPVNLTGCTAKMQAKAKDGAAAGPLLTLTTENGGIALGGAAGTITLNFTAVHSALANLDKAAYDVIVFFGGGLGDQVMVGSLCVTTTTTAIP